MRNWFAALMIAQGSPLILGGDEWMRTQHGNNNAYSTLADNAFNWLQWGTWQQDDARVRMHDFVKQIIELRKSHGDALAPEDWGAAAPFAWKGEANAEPPDWGSRRLMMHWYDESAGPQLLVLVNMERYPVDFTLPAGLTWRRLVDTQRWFDFENPDAADDFFDGGEVDTRRSWNATLDSPEEVPAGSYGVQDSSIVILEAAP
jgi:glycogen operon protein